MRNLVLAGMVLLGVVGSGWAGPFSPLDYAYAGANCEDVTNSSSSQGDLGAYATAECLGWEDEMLPVISEVLASYGSIHIVSMSPDRCCNDTYGEAFSTLLNYVPISGALSNAHGYVEFIVLYETRCIYADQLGHGEVLPGQHHAGGILTAECWSWSIATFETVNFIVPPGGMEYEIALKVFAGGNQHGNFDTLQQISLWDARFIEIPEPSTAALLLSGLGLMWWRRPRGV